MSGPTRFYERADAAPEAGGFAVQLDGRTARSPGRRPLVAPEALARAMAAEWDRQGATLDMARMPLTRHHGRVLDADEEARALWTETPVRYAGTDLLCYRADDPELARKQAATWQPYLDRVGAALGGAFRVTEGVMAVDQDDALLAAVRALAERQPPPGRYALALLTEITGSAALGIAVSLGDAPDAAFAASRLDERHQAERWGADAAAAAREAALASDFASAVRYRRLAAGQRV